MEHGDRFYPSGGTLEEGLCWAEFIFRYGYFLFDLSRSLISIHHAERTQTSISLMQLRAMEHCEICGLPGAGATHI
jgi:hypothetical protein